MSGPGKSVRSCLAFLTVVGLADAAACAELQAETDPITRYVHVTYAVPDRAPDTVRVECTWTPYGADEWQPAKVIPLVSETALNLLRDEEAVQWREGVVIERRAAGLNRTVVFNPYPGAQSEGLVDIDFRVRILADVPLAEYTARIEADNRDVVYAEDWRKVLQRDAVVGEGEQDPAAHAWQWQENVPSGLSFGTGLRVEGGGRLPAHEITYPLKLNGRYAVFVCTGGRSIAMRFTGDETWHELGSGFPCDEVLWRWAAMDRQHLVLQQRRNYEGWQSSGIDYVKFVPLDGAAWESLEAPCRGEHDKFVACFWEPYSWAFHHGVTDPLDHRAVLTAFRDAEVDHVDTQVNRFGSKALFETRSTDQLLFETVGDPRVDESIPHTSNVGAMQQFTNPLDATVRYCRELGVGVHANFGAGICYVGEPLESALFRSRPEWVLNGVPRHELPEVRTYALQLVRDALDMGAPGISLDFMRYPHTVDSAETANTLLRELRALADEFSARRGVHVPILVQFPAKGVLPPEVRERGNYTMFDYARWAREGWVDYMCPSNDDERHLHFDVHPYLDAVAGTPCRVLPNITAAGLPGPGLYLWRVKQVYDAGAPGMYMYQSDQRVLGRPEQRRMVRLLGKSDAVRRWWEEDARMRPFRSKGIYITRPSRPSRGWRGRERIRVWLEGIPMGEVELYLDGKLVSRYDEPPYLLGTEEHASNDVVPPGEHTLLVRARDGGGWLEQEFEITGPTKQ